MSDLNTILKNMDDSKFLETSDITETSTTNSVFMEDIDKSLVKELLPANTYDDNYGYRLMSSSEGFIVVKYDNTTKEVLDEFPITEGLPVQSFEDMRKSILLNSKQDKSSPTYYKDPYSSKKYSYWWFWFIISIPIIVCLCNVLFFYYNYVRR